MDDDEAGGSAAMVTEMDPGLPTMPLEHGPAGVELKLIKERVYVPGGIKFGTVNVFVA